jgi:hypothetical protein
MSITVGHERKREATWYGTEDTRFLYEKSYTAAVSQTQAAVRMLCPNGVVWES